MFFERYFLFQMREDALFYKQSENTDVAGSKKNKMKKTTPEMEEMKLTIAAERGLLDKVKAVGWAGLNARETGKVGGLLMKRRKKLAEKGTE